MKGKNLQPRILYPARTSFRFFKMYLFTYLFLAVLSLCFCARVFSSCGKRGPLFIAVHGPLTIAASLVGSTGSRHTGSVIVAHGPSCSTACGILPDQGSNPCPLHWQADSQPLRHQGRPSFRFDVEMKSFTDKQKLREFSTTKPALQQLLKETSLGEKRPKIET